jgi:hypothetical protein
MPRIVVNVSPAKPAPSARVRFSNTRLANQEGQMAWIVIIALAVISFGLVKARRRKAASGAAHQ